MSNCAFCLFKSNDKVELVKHLFQAHNLESNFFYTCGISSCPRTFTTGATFDAFRSHCARYHLNWKEQIVAPEVSAMDTRSAEVSAMDTTNADIDLPNMDGNSAADRDSFVEENDNSDNQEVDHVDAVKFAAANFLLALKEKFKLSQSTLDYTIRAVEEITTLTTDRVKNSVMSNLHASGVTLDSSFDAYFSSASPFMDLKTEYQQTKYFKEHFGFVEPITVKLGSSFKYKQCGSTRRLVEVNDTFQHIPLLENLERLFCNSDFFKEVSTSHANSDHLIYDFCDGSLFKNHPLFASTTDESIKLQLIVYYDDVEVTNPLGSRRGKYKLALFYYVLGNIKPKYRSALKTIQLIAVVTYPLLKEYGFECVLKPFIEDMKKLGQGCMFSINGKEVLVKGAVLALLADTQAAHAIGGFKVGVGFSLRQCRNCLATKDTMSTQFQESQFVPRTPDTYDYHCSLLSGSFAEADSVTYGINYGSPLNKLENFHVCSGQLPQDIMHILLEGSIPYTMKRMLQSFVNNKKYCTLATINERILCFKFSPNECRSKPCQISFNVLNDEGNINQSAAQMWNLAVYFPLIIGDLVPENDSEWECFLLLLEILQICVTWVASTDLVEYLKVLIVTYLSSFKECYPHARIIPKQHYMVHLPSQILRLGPLTNSWCMRMEAKHNYFKRIAQQGNFKNIALSVAKRHQKLICAILNDTDYFEKSIILSNGIISQTPLTSEPEWIQQSVENHLTVNLFETTITRPKWIESEGNKYRLNDIIWSGHQGELPQFGKINDIISVGDKVFFLLCLYTTKGMDHHHNSFVIEPTQSVIIKLITYEDRLLSFQSHTPSLSDKVHIVSKYFIFKL